MELEQYIESLSYDVAFSLAAAESANAEQLAALGREVPRKLRALAIMHLLTRADPQQYWKNLSMSAALRRDYLAAAIRERKTDGREFAAGRFDHVFDALAAGNVPLAGEIARLSPQAWRPQCEYEDDFCYAAVVHRLLAGAQWTGPSTQVLTGQFEKALEGQDSPRLTLISALARKDDAAFARGFEALLQQRQDEIAERMELGELEEPVVVAERQVFVEGLGLLFMADSIGVETQAEYLFCPSLARPPVPV